MIKRIQRIIKTGVFRNANGLGEFEFKKLTVLYGLNTHGKTTLKDIFHSINEDDPRVILERTSIPNDESLSQGISMSFEEDGSEKTLKFERSAWNPNTLKGKLLIFDNEFTHKNLITGSSVTRDNKESLSDFILGEEGVKLSEAIRELKKDLQDLKAKTIEPPSLKTILDRGQQQAFLNMKVDESETDLNDQRNQKTMALDNLANTEIIKNLDDVKLPEIKLKDELEEILVKINTEFCRDYKEVTGAVLSKIHSHILDQVEGQNGQGWIAQGYTNHKKGDICPFCGQSTKAVADLMDAYSNYFNENYKEFTKEVSDNLSEIERQLLRNELSIFSSFQSLKLLLGEYKKYAPNLHDGVSLNGLQSAEVAMKKALDIEKKAITASINDKKKEPHKVFNDLVLSENFKESFSKLVIEIKNVSDQLTSALDEAKKLKEYHSNLTTEDFQTRKTTLQNEIKKIDLMIARLKEDDYCQTYLADLSKIKGLQDEIERKSNELEAQQSDYVEAYFGELNEVYKTLGSRGFELKSVPNNKGHKKIYELKIYYKGKEVPSNDVTKVLSESDKRSLAFAVFLSKLKHIDNKAEYIVVLDDPVVSFDDNRISTSVDIIKNLSREFKQVIVLTHYPSLVKKMLLANCDGVFLEVAQNNETSLIRRLDCDHFTLSDYELAFNKIHGFVQKEHEQDISKDCRILLERHLQMRFHQGIREKKIPTVPFKDFIDALKDNGHLDDTQFIAIENFREGLNPEHHNFIFDKNPEDVRTYAENLINRLSAL